MPEQRQTVAFTVHTEQFTPVTVEVNGAPIQAHSVELRQVPRDDEWALLNPGKPTLDVTDQYELVLRVRPAESGETIRMIKGVIDSE